MNVLLSSACWPNLHYFYYVLNAQTILIEQHDHYQKQSYRNRFQVLSANGVLDLSVPVRKLALKELMKDVEISYAEKWQMRHWRAITSAYRNSPFFEYFESEIEAFYTKPYEKLLDMNLEQLNLVLKLLRQKRTITLTTDYIKDPAEIFDARELIHPKKNIGEDQAAAAALSKPYYQTFESKFSFTPNLSILDLLFNTGMGAVDHLRANNQI